MANLLLSDLYTSLRRKYGLSDIANFQNAFTDASNDAIAIFNTEVYAEATVDYVADYAAITGGAEGPDESFRPYFRIVLEYALQEGGEWAIEPDAAMEGRKIRAVRDARNLNRQNTTYVNPLGI